MHDQEPVNILDLVKSLRDDTTGLIRDEVALAKTEISEKIATASRNVGYLAVGALVAYAGLIFLLVAVGFILRAMFLAGDVSEPVANLLSFLIVGVIVGGVGASLVMKAINTLKKESPIPTKTVKTLEEDKEWGTKESLMKNEEVQNTEDRSSSEIASDIRERRNRMDETLGELSNQFTVRSIVNSVLDWCVNRQVSMPGGGVAKSAYRNVAYQVRKHPLPAVLVGTGIAWMIIDAVSEDEGSASSARGDVDDRRVPGAFKESPDLLEKAQTKLGQAKHAASDVAGAAKEKASALGHAASDVAGVAKEKASALGNAASGAAENLTRRAQDVYSQSRSTAVRVGQGVQQGYRSGAEQLETAMREFPLAVAIGFAAAGALLECCCRARVLKMSSWEKNPTSSSKRLRKKVSSSSSAARQSPNKSPNPRWMKRGSRV